MAVRRLARKFVFPLTVFKKAPAGKAKNETCFCRGRQEWLRLASLLQEFFEKRIQDGPILAVNVRQKPLTRKICGVLDDPVRTKQSPTTTGLPLVLDPTIVGLSGVIKKYK
jgi:hypothetical protein